MEIYNYKKYEISNQKDKTHRVTSGIVHEWNNTALLKTIVCQNSDYASQS